MVWIAVGADHPASGRARADAVDGCAARQCTNGRLLPLAPAKVEPRSAERYAVKFMTDEDGYSDLTRAKSFVRGVISTSS